MTRTNRVVRYEVTRGVVKVPLSGKLGAGRYALVSAEDLPKVALHSWHLKANNHENSLAVCTNIARKSVKLHRFLRPDVVGIVDHENGDQLDCTRRNLRPAIDNQNQQNCRMRRDNTSGFRGVHLDSRTGRWRATAQDKGVKKSLGCHPTAREAALAYDRRVRWAHGVFARLNFPERGERGLDGLVKS